MTNREWKLARLVVILAVVLLVVTAANALIDLGAVIHDLTHTH